ncbi:TPA: 50S ribosomal protein L10 [Candidatus Micrarchaeota archaeon]|nr:50S ribosomal protein L10 [Candidatus Micrarchaeota archaeon]
MISKQQKIQAVEEAKKKAKQYPIVAVASIASLPSRHFNSIKKKIRGQAEIVFTRHTLLKKALGEARPDAKELENYLGNGGVLVFSALPAFKLYKLFKQNKSKALAKAGQLAPYDIIVPAGETNLAPGPVLTELKQAKIDAKIQGTKVVIAKDTVVAKKGEAISEQVAKILGKLAIEPMESGIEVQAVLDNGLLYKSDVLNIDEAGMLAQLQQAHTQAVNLAVFAGIVNSTTVKLLIGKAARQATALEQLVESKQNAPAQEAAEAKAPETQPAQDAAAPATETAEAAQAPQEPAPQ